MRCVMKCLHQSLPHDAGRRHSAIKPVTSHHVDNGANSAPFLTNHHPIGILKFHFRRGIGFVSQFLFEPLDKKIVSLTVWPPARHKKTGNVGIFCACQYKKCVTHGRGTKELMTGQQIFSANSACCSNWHRKG